MLRFSTLGVCASPAAFGGTAPPALADVVWSADPSRSGVRIAVSHLLLRRITGTIPIASATIVTADTQTVPLLIDAMLDAAALTTRDAQRDAQLRSERFFGAARFPRITFASEHVDETGLGTFVVAGELTMRGVTRPMTFDTRIVALRRGAAGKCRVRYQASGCFLRSEFGMSYARGLVGDEVALEVTIEAAN